MKEQGIIAGSRDKISINNIISRGNKMVLHNLNIINNGIQNIRVNGERITAVHPAHENPDQREDIHLYFEDCIAFPGLINSHDHLDFNLFPQLGHTHYKNYLDWGNDIHIQDKAIIRSILKIPVTLRSRWGMYKNLLNGITTVVHHGEKPEIDEAPVSIFTRCHSLHSIALEKKWKYRLNRPFMPDCPFVIHIGEGTDRRSFEEINHLLRWNFFKRKLVGVHGVAMDDEQAAGFDALIWCPDSNFFSLGATAAIDKIKTATTILFGTDSTLSAGWSIWQQLRKARTTALLTDQELMNAVSSSPAAIWKLACCGALEKKYYADIVITRKTIAGGSDADAFFASDPENIILILRKGVIVLFDASMLAQLKEVSVEKYSKIFIGNNCKYVIGGLTELIKKIRTYAPEAAFPVNME